MHFFEVLTEGQIISRSNPDDVRSILTDESATKSPYRSSATVQREALPLLNSVNNPCQMKQFLLGIVQGHRDKESKTTQSSYMEYTV